MMRREDLETFLFLPFLLEFSDSSSEARLVPFAVCNSLSWITCFRSRDFYDLEVLSVGTSVSNVY